MPSSTPPQSSPYPRGGSSMELFFLFLTPALSLSKEREEYGIILFF